MSKDIDLEKEVQNMDEEELKKVLDLVNKMEMAMAGSGMRRRIIELASKIAPRKKQKAAYELANEIVAGEE